MSGQTLFFFDSNTSGSLDTVPSLSLGHDDCESRLGLVKVSSVILASEEGGKG